MDFIKAAGAALFGPRPDTTSNQDTLNESEIVKYVKSKVDVARQNPARVAFESGVVTNTAYLLGYDSIFFDANLRIFRNYAGTAASPRRGRIHKNLILPNIQNRLARLCKNPPRYDVRPNSPSEDDKEAARLSLKTLTNVMDRERYNEKRIENAMWMQQAGYSWIKVGWDPEKGRKIAYQDDDGSNDFEYEGDIYLEVTSPLEVFVDPMARSMQDCAWLVHTKVRTLSYFRNSYDKGYQVKAEGPYLNNIANLLRINSMTNRSGTMESQMQMKDCAIEIAYYEKPTKKFPNGRLIITAGGILLAYKPLPIDEIPFIKFDDVKVGGKFHSESLITHLRPIQDQLNRILRRKAEYANKGLALKYMAAKGHGLHEEALNDTTEVMEYNHVEGTPAPTKIDLPVMPQYVFQEDDTLKQAFNEIIGLGESSHGQLESASIPAIGMQLLVEQDETRIGVVVESNENSHADVARVILKFAGRYYQTPRVLKENGKNGEYLFTEVTAEKLRESYDVICIRGSTLPGSKAAKRQDLMNLYNQGLLGDPTDPSVRSRLLEAMEYGDLATVWEDLAVDSQQVERSIEQIEQGIAPPIDPDDNHQMHFEKKNRLRKSQKFLTYSPQVQELLKANIQVHKSFLQPPMPMGPPGMPPPPGLMGQPPEGDNGAPPGGEAMPPTPIPAA